jgi:hypothetical protein
MLARISSASLVQRSRTQIARFGVLSNCHLGNQIAEHIGGSGTRTEAGGQSRNVTFRCGRIAPNRLLHGGQAYWPPPCSSKQACTSLRCCVLSATRTRYVPPRQLAASRRPVCASTSTAVLAGPGVVMGFGAIDTGELPADLTAPGGALVG